MLINVNERFFYKRHNYQKFNSLNLLPAEDRCIFKVSFPWKINPNKLQLINH